MNSVSGWNKVTSQVLDNEAVNNLWTVNIFFSDSLRNKGACLEGNREMLFQGLSSLILKNTRSI